MHYVCMVVVHLTSLAKSIVVNSLTGVLEELTSSTDASILSRREKQVLALIDSGKRSYEIAEILSISKNTVSRHRQENTCQTASKELDGGLPHC